MKFSDCLTVNSLTVDRVTSRKTRIFSRTVEEISNLASSNFATGFVNVIEWRKEVVKELNLLQHDSFTRIAGVFIL